MHVDIITIFPGIFSGPLDFGVLRRARETGLVSIALHDLRTFTTDRHRTVDDRPYGGGEGMVLKPGPLAAAIDALALEPPATRPAARQTVILLSPQGTPFTQRIAAELASLTRIVLVCGRYEGVDERVNQLLCDRELTIGDYILSGGELAAAVLVDSIVRLLPGVLGNPASARHESFGNPDLGPAEPGSLPRSTHGAGGLLDYPHYTRPPAFRGLDVPPVLSGGDHDAIRRWRHRMSLAKTLRNRPDLLRTAALSPEDRTILRSLGATPSDLPPD